jgi:hypothetical protein
MANENKDVIRVEMALEASASATLRAKQAGYALDSRRRIYKEAGGTLRYYWDSTRLADTSGSYGDTVIGCAGITGITPNGGSSGAAATLHNMLIGLRDYTDSGALTGTGTANAIMLWTGARAAGDSILSQIAGGGSGNKIQFNADSVATLYRQSAGVLQTDGAFTALGNITGTLISAGSLQSDADLVVGQDSDLQGFVDIGLSADLDNEATGAAFADILGVVTKDDTDTCVFRSLYINPTFNPGASNANTTFNVVEADTVNTALTGTTVNLLRLAFGGSLRLNLSSAGVMELVGTLNLTGTGNLSGKYASLIGTGDGMASYGIVTATGTITTPVADQKWNYFEGDFRKNDSNTRQHSLVYLYGRLQAGGSNANETINLLALDTLNTVTTGITLNLIRALYGGAERFRVDSGGAVHIQSNQIIGTRQTGWTAWTGSATRSSFATGSATLTNVAEALKALIDDLITHGLIGT